MKNFRYQKASTVKEALAQLKAAGGAAKLMAGGTDLLGEMKDGIARPERVIHLRIPQLNHIQADSKGLRIGALTPLSQVAAHPQIKEGYTALAQAAEEMGSPQLRHIGTLGGNLCQRPRCWYYRGEFPCLKKGGESCYAVAGQNKYHAILGGGPCFMVHPSDTAPALIALGASVKIASPRGERVVPLEQFFISPRQDGSREHILQPDELLAEVQLPPPPEGSRSLYLKARERRCWDFALASVALVQTVKGGACQGARVVLGGVAPIPYRALKAEGVLKGKRIDEALATQAGQLAVFGARPLSQNSYKEELTRTLVRRAVLATT
ncbi:MAG: xanthine dehydrogenase family protein subunit M [Chloroflexi bacterium]|nr:xanthine dehydrogenase family protein subunit M [Chloroflexota bacterium]